VNTWHERAERPVDPLMLLHEPEPPELPGDDPGLEMVSPTRRVGNLDLCPGERRRQATMNLFRIDHPLDWYTRRHPQASHLASAQLGAVSPALDSGSPARLPHARQSFWLDFPVHPRACRLLA